jgi:hypothetical protein
MGDHSKSYVVKALAAIVNVDGGFAQLLQRGAAVPSNVKPDHLEHLLANDIVEEGEPAAGLATVYSGDLQKPVTGDKAVPDDVDGPDGPIPPKSADKATWVTFAVSKGATQDEAEASTKEDLIAAYGS